MRRIFLFGVIAYAIASLVLTHLPTMQATTGAESFPWLAMMTIDVAFAAFSAFKLIGPSFFETDDDEPSIDASDVSVPDSWLYGLFGIYLLVNGGVHGWYAAMTTGAVSIYNAVWFLVEASAIFLTYVFFKNAVRAARRKASKTGRPTPVRVRDVA